MSKPVCFAGVDEAAAAFALAGGLAFRCRVCGGTHRSDGFSWFRCLSRLNRDLLRTVMGEVRPPEMKGCASLAFVSEAWRNWWAPEEHALERSLTATRPWLLAVDPAVGLPDLVAAVVGDLPRLREQTRAALHAREEYAQWVETLRGCRPPARVVEDVPYSRDVMWGVAFLRIAPAVRPPHPDAESVVEVPQAVYLEHAEGARHLLWAGYGTRAFGFLAVDGAWQGYVQYLERYGERASIRRLPVRAAAGEREAVWDTARVTRHIRRLQERCGV
ncbi:MAG: hypothetical protein AB1816_00045 [Bacillota bacterium]